ncbi:TRAP transporter large permease [Nannocystaceae bacterium ST9]
MSNSNQSKRDRGPSLLAPAPSAQVRKRATLFGSVCVFAFVLLLAATAMAEGGISQNGPVLSLGAGLAVLFATLALAVVLGMPLFVIIGLIATSCFLFLSENFDGLLTLDRLSDTGAEMMTKDVLLAIPFFVASGAIMSAGGIARRLVDVARALVGWMPGGLAIAAVGACVIFAAISGSSPVTVIAIGSMMYPRLVEAGYERRFSLGLVTAGGSLGILIPPSIPMLVYAIVASGSKPIDVAELFLAGVLPGLMIGLLLALLAPFNAKKVARETFEFKVVLQRIRDGIWSLSLPAVILGGIYTGVFTPTEAAAISVVYSLIIELLIHRDISPQDIPKILTESVVNMGTILIIMLLAFGLNAFLVEEMIPQKVVAWILDKDLTPVTFLLIVNIFLLIVGALMDSISAILIIAPLLAPIGVELGIDPIHLGIIFIVNLEIGYLTPPIGINLFVSSSVFRQPLGEVTRGVVPFIGMMLIGLVAVTYVPSIALGPVNKVMREKDFYEPFPEAREVHVMVDDEDSDEDVVGDAFQAPPVPTVGPTGKKVKTMAEIMAEEEAKEAAQGSEDDEDEDDEDEGSETEDEPEPVFKGPSQMPKDPDED